jgi:prepilin-type N-terminal cleavage/methylation domain
MFEFFTKLKSDRGGFTLIELLVVISIIGVLSGMVLVGMTDMRARARDARRQSDITQIRKALELYYADNGTYPVRSWTISNNATNWNAFKTQLANYVSLPADPVNTPIANPVNYPWTTVSTYLYAYYASGYGCSGHWYMLSYRLEKPNMASPGARSCPCTVSGTYYPDGYLFNYGSTNPSSVAYGVITVGMRQR